MHLLVFTWKRSLHQTPTKCPNTQAPRSGRLRRCHIPRKAGGNPLVSRTICATISAHLLNLLCLFPSVLHLQELLVELHINLSEASADLLESPAVNPIVIFM